MPEAANPTAPGAQPKAAPFGQSPVTGPSPNKGFEAAALKRAGLVVKQLNEMLGMVGVGTDIGKDVLKAMNLLAKHVPSGSVTPADEKVALERQMMNNTQNNQQQQMLKQQMLKQQMQQAQQGGQQQAAA